MVDIAPIWTNLVRKWSRMTVFCGAICRSELRAADGMSNDMAIKGYRIEMHISRREILR